DLNEGKVALLAQRGVTRVSLGAQSFDASKLATLERDHRREQIARAFELARQRVQSVSLDLIFAAPGETLACWSSDLEAALQLGPDHISTYGLTIERGAAFFSRRERGTLVPLDEE